MQKCGVIYRFPFLSFDMTYFILIIIFTNFEPCHALLLHSSPFLQIWLQPFNSCKNVNISSHIYIIWFSKWWFFPKFFICIKSAEKIVELNFLIAFILFTANITDGNFKSEIWVKTPTSETKSSFTEWCTKKAEYSNIWQMIIAKLWKFENLDVEIKYG